MRAAAAYHRSRDHLQQVATVSRPVGGPLTRSASRYPSSPPRLHEPDVEVVSADDDTGIQHPSCGRVGVLHNRRPARKEDRSASKRAADEEGTNSSGGGSEEKRRRCGGTGRSVNERMRNACNRRGGIRQLETRSGSLSRIATITLSDDDGEGDIFPKVMAPRQSNSLSYEYAATKNATGTKTIKTEKSRTRQKSVGRKCRRNLKTELGNLSICTPPAGNDNTSKSLHPALENGQRTAHRAGLLCQGSSRSKSSSHRSLYDVALCARKLYFKSVLYRGVGEKFTPGNPRLESFLQLKRKKDHPLWSVESRELEEAGTSLAQLDGSDGWPPSGMVLGAKDASAQPVFPEGCTDLNNNNNRVRHDGTKIELNDKSLSAMALPIQPGHCSKEILEVDNLKQRQLESPGDNLDGKERAARKNGQQSLATEWRECANSGEDSGSRSHRKLLSKTVTQTILQPQGKQTREAGVRDIAC